MERNWVGVKVDRDAPPLGSHCPVLSPCTGGGQRLLALDLRAERTLQPGGGAQGRERARDWAVSRGTLLFPQSLSVSGSSGASEGSLHSVCLDPQAALPHAFHSGPNSSPCFPPQVGRNSLVSRPHVHAPAYAHMHRQGCTCPHAQTRTQT